MSNVNEIKTAINTLIKNGTSRNKEISILQCTSAYPAPAKEWLRTIQSFKKIF